MMTIHSITLLLSCEPAGYFARPFIYSVYQEISGKNMFSIINATLWLIRNCIWLPLVLSDDLGFGIFINRVHSIYTYQIIHPKITLLQL
jgi:hypothetical protein